MLNIKIFNLFTFYIKQNRYQKLKRSVTVTLYSFFQFLKIKKYMKETVN